MGKYCIILKTANLVFSENVNSNIYCCKWYKVFVLTRTSAGESRNGFQRNQKEIIQFVNHCKDHENSDGYLRQDFFEFNNFSTKRTFIGILKRNKLSLKIFW